MVADACSATEQSGLVLIEVRSVIGNKRCAFSIALLDIADLSSLAECKLSWMCLVCVLPQGHSHDMSDWQATLISLKNRIRNKERNGT